MNRNANADSRQQLVWLVVAMIIFLAALLRFQAISSTTVDTPIRADARLYYFYALNIERWGVFSKAPPSETPPQPDAFAPPGLPFAFTPFIEFPPSDRMLFRFNTIQALLGCATVLLTFLFFRLFTTQATALGTAFLTAISPHLVVMTTYLLTETLFTFLLVAAVYLVAEALKRNNAAIGILAGLFVGLTALTRATTEYLPVFMTALLWVICDWQRFKRVVLPMALFSISVIIAWKIRNLVVTGALSDPTLMISTLHHGMYPDFMFNNLPESKGAPYRFDPGTAGFTDSVGGVIDEIVRRFSAHPLRYAYWYLLGKPTALLSWDMIDGMGDIFIYPVQKSPYFDHSLFQATRVIIYLLHVPLSVTAVVGCVLVAMRPRLLGIDGEQRLLATLAVILIAYFFAIHLLGAPFPRYGVPLRPFVYGFGLFTAVALFRKFQPIRLSNGQANT